MAAQQAHGEPGKTKSGRATAVVVLVLLFPLLAGLPLPCAYKEVDHAWLQPCASGCNCSGFVGNRAWLHRRPQWGNLAALSLQPYTNPLTFFSPACVARRRKRHTSLSQRAKEACAAR